MFQSEQVVTFRTSPWLPQPLNPVDSKSFVPPNPQDLSPPSHPHSLTPLHPKPYTLCPTSPAPTRRERGSDAEMSSDFGESSAGEVHLLRAENAALRSELAALRATNGFNGRAMADALAGGAGAGSKTSGPNACAKTWTSPGAGDALSGAELERFARHLSLPAFGATKQARPYTLNSEPSTHRPKP